MEKKILNEELARIKSMMGKVMTESFDDFETQVQPEELPQEPEYENTPDMSLEGAVAKLHEFRIKLDAITEEFYSMFKDTDYWLYVNNVYQALHTISNSEGDTRSGEGERNITNMIDYIQQQFAPQSDDNQDDMPGFEGTNDALNNLGIR